MLYLPLSLLLVTVGAPLRDHGSGWAQRREGEIVRSVRVGRRAQAGEARRAAVEEVERLLQHPEDLKRLPALREETAQKLQARSHATAALKPKPWS